MTARAEPDRRTLARAWSAPASAPRSPRRCRSGRAGAAASPSTYRLIDAEAARARGRRPARAAGLGASGSGSTGSTSPTRSSRRWCRCSTSCPRTPRTWARSTPSSSGTAGGSAATPTGPATAGRSARCCPTPSSDRVVLVGAGGAGVAVGLRPAATRAPSTSPSLDADAERADACAVRLAKRFGDDRVSVGHRPRRARSADAQRARQRDAGRDARPPRYVGPGRAAARRTCGSATSSTSRSRPSWSRLARAARLPGAARRRHGGAARRSARSSYFTGRTRRRRPDGAALRGADRLMRKGIATVSVSGVLADKLDAIAAAGLRRRRDLRQRPGRLAAVPARGRGPLRRPRPARSTCSSRCATSRACRPSGSTPCCTGSHQARRDGRARRRPRVLACSNVQPDAVDDLDLTAEQLHRVGELAAEHGVTVAYEALAWGRHVNRVGQAWEAVRRADHPPSRSPSTPSTCSRAATTATALAGVPGDRIGFLQVADAPLLDMNLLEWSRHFRCFPGPGHPRRHRRRRGHPRGGLPRPAVARGVQRRRPRGRPVGHRARRDALAGVPRGPARAGRDRTRRASWSPPAPPPPARTRRRVPGARRPAGDDSARPTCSPALGFARAGRHRSKPVTWWRNGDAHVVVNAGTGRRPACARPRSASSAPPVEAVAARAEALLWPAVDTHPRRRRGAAARASPRPSGLHVFVSDAPGGERPLAARLRARSAPTTGRRAGSASTTSASPCSPTSSTRRSAFFRTLFGLAPGRGRGVHGAARPAAQPGAAPAAGRPARRPERRRAPRPATRTRAASTRSPSPAPTCVADGRRRCGRAASR